MELGSSLIRAPTAIGAIPPGDDEAENYATTYKKAYKPTAVLPPIKFRQNPSLEIRDVPMLAPREFPVIPIGPHRHLVADRALCLGVGTRDINTERLLDPKPIVQTVPPRERRHRPRTPNPLLRHRKASAKGTRKSNPLSSTEEQSKTETIRELPHNKVSVFKAICDYVTGTSTTRSATEEAKIPYKKIIPPSTTFEENADMVKYRPARYESSNEDWQRFAGEWDRFQSRPRSDKALLQPIYNPRHSRLIIKGPNKSEDKSPSNQIGELLKTGRISSAYEKPCPGYAGFVPRSPVEAELERRRPVENYRTVMKGSYRQLPSYEYQIMAHAHPGPMSRTVTLTYPYNPFNKVE